MQRGEINPNVKPEKISQPTRPIPKPTKPKKMTLNDLLDKMNLREAYSTVLVIRDQYDMTKFLGNLPAFRARDDRALLGCEVEAFEVGTVMGNVTITIRLRGGKNAEADQ